MTTKNDSKAETAEAATPSTLRKINIRRVVEALRQKGALTRAELTRFLGVSAPTMSKLLDDLMKLRLIEEEGVPVVGKGRPSKRYHLNENSLVVTGGIVRIDVCTFFVASLSSHIDEDSIVSFPTPDSYDELVETFRANLEAAYNEDGRRCLGFGLCVPGLVNQAENRLMLAPNLHYLDGTQPARDITQGLDVSALLLHELQALCLAEQQMGQARSVRDFAVLDITGGLGMGVMSGGQFIHGRDGYAGEIGHMTVKLDGEKCGCGNHGCLETIATDQALLRHLGQLKGRRLDIDEAVELLRAGGEEEMLILNEFLEYLAIGAAAIVNIFNPDLVCVNSEFLKRYQGWFDAFVKLAVKRSLDPSIESCSFALGLGTRMEGAAAGVNDQLFATVGPDLVSP